MSMEMMHQKKREWGLWERSLEGRCLRKQAEGEQVACDGTGTLLYNGKEQRMWVRQVDRFGGGKVGFLTKRGEAMLSLDQLT